MALKDKLTEWFEKHPPWPAEKTIKWVYRIAAPMMVVSWFGLIYGQYTYKNARNELETLYQIENPSSEQCTKISDLEKALDRHNQTKDTVWGGTIGISALTIMFGYTHHTNSGKKSGKTPKTTD